MSHLRMRYNQLRNAESLKDALLEDVLEKCSELQARNDCLSHQLNGIDYKGVVEQLTGMMNRQTLMVGSQRFQMRLLCSAAD